MLINYILGHKNHFFVLREVFLIITRIVITPPNVYDWVAYLFKRMHSELMKLKKDYEAKKDM